MFGHRRVAVGVLAGGSLGLTGDFLMRAALALFVAGLFAVSPLAAQETRNESGKLSAKDRKLPSGEYYETFDLELAAGQTISADLQSDDFDTFVQINGLDAAGEVDRAREWFNDDLDNAKNRSKVEVTIPVAGTYRVMVTSYAADETGAYSLQIVTGASPAVMPAEGALAPVPAGPNDRVELGTLNRFDTQLEDGEYVDIYPMELGAGDRVTVDLTSDNFDTYLYMRTDVDPELVVVNDDFESSRSQSQITFVAPQNGTYRIYVTTYEKQSTGDYRLVMRVQPAAAIDAVAGPTVRNESGFLTADDVTLTSGEYVDEFKIAGAPGMQVRIELNSSDFDTYVMIKTPSGGSLDNDDFEGSNRRSVIETELTEVGEHRVLVTTYKPGETGAYELSIVTSGSGGVGEDGLLVSGSRMPGSLTKDDEVIEGDRRADTYAFVGSAGETLQAKLTSEAFDSYLMLVAPDGTVTTYDDDGADRNAAINIKLEQSGRYSLICTSYTADSVGDYELTFNLGEGGSPAPTAGRRLFGVFAGISDYPGEDGDLERCDLDAERIYSLLRDNYGMRAEDSQLLVNGDATVAAVTDALERVGQKAGPNDLFIFFYSGHGDQLTGESDSSDPDGIHETLALVDGQIVDDDFAAIVNRSPAGVALVVFDACFSGGFAKDVVSARGRMGIFSSEEDVLSNVAEQFEAGGFLSRFMVDALLDQREIADMNADSQLTAHELSHYLGERYRDDVRSSRVKGGQDGIDPSENLSFQRLVVDRGGVNSGEVLFRW